MGPLAKKELRFETLGRKQDTVTAKAFATCEWDARNLKARLLRACSACAHHLTGLQLCARAGGPVCGIRQGAACLQGAALHGPPGPQADGGHALALLVHQALHCRIHLRAHLRTLPVLRDAHCASRTQHPLSPALTPSPTLRPFVQKPFVQLRENNWAVTATNSGKTVQLSYDL